MFLAPAKELADWGWHVRAVMVNQIRGRPIRISADDPVKVANNWDVLCLSSFGESTELARLSKKHAGYYGVTEDGLVQRGGLYNGEWATSMAPLTEYHSKSCL